MLDILVALLRRMGLDISCLFDSNQTTAHDQDTRGLKNLGSFRLEPFQATRSTRFTCPATRQFPLHVRTRRNHAGIKDDFRAVCQNGLVLGQLDNSSGLVLYLILFHKTP